MRTRIFTGALACAGFLALAPMMGEAPAEARELIYSSGIPAKHPLHDDRCLVGPAAFAPHMMHHRERAVPRPRRSQDERVEDALEEGEPEIHLRLAALTSPPTALHMWIDTV